MRTTPRLLSLSILMLLSACADPAQPALCIDCEPVDMSAAPDLPLDLHTAPDQAAPDDMMAQQDQDMDVAGCGALAPGASQCGVGREVLFCQDSTLQTILCPEGTVCGDDGEIACFCDDLADMLCPDPACVRDTDCEQQPVCDCTNKTCGCEGACGTCDAGQECVESISSASCAPLAFVNYTVAGALTRSHDARADSARLGQQRSPIYCELVDSFDQKQLNLRVDTQHPDGHITYIQLTAREDERADGVYMSSSDELVSALYSELKDSGNLRYGYQAGQNIQGCQLNFRMLETGGLRSYVEGSFTCSQLPGLNTTGAVQLSATFRCYPCC